MGSPGGLSYLVSSGGWFPDGLGYQKWVILRVIKWVVLGVRSGVVKWPKIGVPVLEGTYTLFEPRVAISPGGILRVFLDPCFRTLFPETPILVRLVLFGFPGISDQWVWTLGFRVFDQFLINYGSKSGTPKVVILRVPKWGIWGPYIQVLSSLHP